MSRLTPLSPAVSARVAPCSLDRRFALVDASFAPKLRTEHAQRFEHVAGSTPTGDEFFTADVPNVSLEELEHLDEAGLAQVGTEVKPGTILVGRATPLEGTGKPLAPEEKLLRAIFGDGAVENRDTSLRAPPGCFGVVRRAAIEPGERPRAIVEVAWERPLEVGDVLLVDGQPVVVAGIEALAADLAWSGGVAEVSVAKAASARDVMHARSVGPYSPQTQLPPAGRERAGGQPIERGQLERLAAHAPWAAWELLTLKADCVEARARLHDSLLKLESLDVSPPPAAAGAGTSGRSFSFFQPLVKTSPGEVPAIQPESVALLVASLRALALEPDLRGAEVSLRIATPEDIRGRSRGAVQPTLEGLRCQRLFGPQQDYKCACGKYSRMRDRGLVCDECGVEVITSRVRRERFGHVELAAPCLHPLFAGEVATLLGLREDEVRGVIAGASVLVPAGGWTWKTEPGSSAHGGRALWEALAQLNLAALAGETGPRAELATALMQSEQSATALMLTVLPVLPPDLRGDDSPADPSELDRLYYAVLERNERVAALAREDAPARSLAPAQAELQQTLDRLLLGDRHDRSKQAGALAGRVDKLLAEQVFTKCVDFSGVAHLVVDPALPPGECRVPHEMLLDLFKPHALGVLETRGYTATIKTGTRMLEQRQPEALAAVEEASDGYPVLLMAGSAIVCRRVRGWDRPAVAVDPATAERLEGLTVTLHVPLLYEAALQCDRLADLPEAAKSRGDGWLSRAPQRWWLWAVARQAALAGEREELADPVVRIALGRLPEPVDVAEREGWAAREHERRERVWERVQPPPLDEVPPQIEHLDRPLAELGLSDRTAQVLVDAGLRTLADLCTRREVDLIRLPNFERQQLKEIKAILADFGLSLGMSLG